MKRCLSWLFLGVVLLVPWLYGLGFPFQYDDVGMIAENGWLADPGNAAAVLSGRTLADPHVLNGRRPAVLASYFLDRAFHGLRPAGWRATNLLVHLANAGLLSALAYRLSRRRTLAALAALLFALHPVLTEPVHAPGFRADILCLFFSLLALHAWLSATAGTPRRRIPAAAWGSALFLFLAAALLSKETAVAWPLAAALLLVLYPARFPRRRAAWGLLGGAIGLAAGFFVLWSVLPAELQAAGGSWNGESLRPPENLWSFPALWTRTLRLVLVPWPLNVTPRFDPVASPADGRFWMGLFWMAVCATAAWKARRRLPTVALGLGWMAVWFLPVSNLWPLYHPVADRYLYPVVPGFALLAAWLLEQQPPVSRRVGAAFIALLYAGLLVVRVHQWRTPESLWTAAFFQNRKSATAATWLGLLSEERGDSDAAADFYRAATEANPRAVHAWIDWGVLEGRCGNYADSERLLLTALELSPSNATATANLALCRSLMSNPPPAAGP
jgi:tetratricopeptide (TPR) repeat protein